ARSPPLLPGPCERAVAACSRRETTPIETAAAELRRIWPDDARRPLVVAWPRSTVVERAATECAEALVGWQGAYRSGRASRHCAVASRRALLGDGGLPGRPRHSTSGWV